MVESWRFENPSSSPGIFFTSKPNPFFLLPALPPERWRNLMRQNPCQDVLGISNRRFSTAFTPPPTTPLFTLQEADVRLMQPSLLRQFRPTQTLLFPMSFDDLCEGISNACWRFRHPSQIASHRE